METAGLWNTLVGARFVDKGVHVRRVEVSENVAHVYYKDGDVEDVYLVDYSMPNGVYQNTHEKATALEGLRKYARAVATAVGKRADELEAKGREDAPSILKALLDLELFTLVGWIIGRRHNSQIVGTPILRVGGAELQFPVEVVADPLACEYSGPHGYCKLQRQALVYPEVRRCVRNAWLTVATGHWKYALSRLGNI